MINRHMCGTIPIPCSRDDRDQVNQFLDSPYAPFLKNTTDNEAKRKQNTAKAIATAFQNAQFGGDL